MSELERQIARRRTLAIISRPGPGKTEKLLLFGGVIQMASTLIWGA